MDPSQLLFDVLSELTGGMISDVTTLYVGAVVIFFLVVGFQYLAGVFDTIIDSRDHRRYSDSADAMREERDQYSRGSREWDEANYLYRHYVGRAAKTRLKR